MKVGWDIIKGCKNKVGTLTEIDTLKTPFITKMYMVSRLVVTSRATVWIENKKVCREHVRIGINTSTMVSPLIIWNWQAFSAKGHLVIILGNSANTQSLIYITPCFVIVCLSNPSLKEKK